MHSIGMMKRCELVRQNRTEHERRIKRKSEKIVNSGKVCHSVNGDDENRCDNVNEKNLDIILVQSVTLDGQPFIHQCK